MKNNYKKIVRDNLSRLYSCLPDDLAEFLPGTQDGLKFSFSAFGEKCDIEPEGISLGDGEHSSVLDIIISLYALNARSETCVLLPLKAFKELENSMPYVGAFSAHTEQILVPYVPDIKKSKQAIIEALNGEDAPAEAGGDFSLIVHPLPKIALCYIFYDADEDFPASVTCLFSANAGLFMSVDGLADLGEYTSRTILKLIESN